MKSYFIAGLAFAFAGCAGVVSTPLSGGVTVPPARVTSLRAGSTPIVGEYFSLADEKSGNIPWNDRLRATTPLEKLTRLYINAGWLKPDKTTGKYTLQLQYDYMEPRIAELLKAVREKNPQAQLLIVSGYDDGTMYHAAAKDPKYFADSVVSFIRKYQLDGYDCDWENDVKSDELIAIASAVRNALDAAGKVDGKQYLFTQAVWPNPSHEDYPLPRLGQLLDQIEIMSYGTGDKLSVDAPKYVKGGFPRNKIMGGVETEADYPEGGPDELGPGKSIEVKAMYARKNGLAGMMAWRMDNDYDEAKPEKQPTYKGAVQLWESMTR